MIDAPKPIPVITTEQRRDLRAAAHHLKPVVSISQKGLQATVLSEIDRSLTAPELIKVRLYGIDRDQRSALENEICAALACVNVQQIGNLLVLWRQRADSTDELTLAGRRSAMRSGKPLTKKQAAAFTEVKAARRSPVKKRP